MAKNAMAIKSDEIGRSEFLICPIIANLQLNSFEMVFILFNSRLENAKKYFFVLINSNN